MKKEGNMNTLIMLSDFDEHEADSDVIFMWMFDATTFWWQRVDVIIPGELAQLIENVSWQQNGKLDCQVIVR